MVWCWEERGSEVRTVVLPLIHHVETAATYEKTLAFFLFSSLFLTPPILQPHRPLPSTRQLRLLAARTD